jgi:exonuclease SbcC
MILTRIDIENFKRYRGEHSIDIPALATVGVIGENGTGKTTLFEAIEWCLYSPRSIAPADVRPRGATGHTTVTVYLESMDGSVQYAVQRVLKRTPTASIFRIDENGGMEKIADGAKQVSDYVSTKLIGLSHTAFTATFFTRQKELHLFGDEAPGKRREEVGRLLGLETIRSAQKLINTDRAQATAAARALHAQYQRESEGRDFPAELTAIEERIAQRKADRLAATQAIVSTAEALALAEASLTTAIARRDQDATLGHAMTTNQQEQKSLLTRSSQIDQELAALQLREQERISLVKRAANLDALLREVAEQEEQRTQYEKRNELDRVVKDATNRRKEVLASVQMQVDRIRLTSPIDGWFWTTDDNLNPTDGIKRLIGISTALDVVATERQEHALRRCLNAAARLEKERETLERYRIAQAELEKQANDAVREGEPRDEIPRIDAQRDRLLHQRTTLDASRTNLESERDRTRRILANLNSQQFDDGCPTCGRPFSQTDAELVAGTLASRVQQLDADIIELTDQARSLTKGLDDLELRRKDVFARIDSLEKTRARLTKSVAILETQVDSTNAAQTELTTALADAGRTDRPSARDLETAERRTKLEREVRATRSGLQPALQSLTTVETQLAEASGHRQKLNDISFDPNAYRALRERVQEADRAKTAIIHIDRELARRPSLQTERASLAARLAEIENELANLTAQRTALAYQAVELTEGQSARDAARAAERQALDHAHRAESALRDAEHARDIIVREQERLANLASLADQRQSEADTLDMMSREFTEFERFAAARKLPILSDITSQLVQSITAGRYERVDFDSDFGIVVYDGDSSDSSYPLATFSGGERDAITLAARLALSHMIGRQAANPPGFLVLDEVFGSLDANRRAQLIDLLGAITGTFEELRQVFIISHVDDVRSSPAIDELWRIEETPDGGSSLTPLAAGTEIDTL